MENVFSWIKSRNLEADLFQVVQQNMGRTWVTLFVSDISTSLCNKVKMPFVLGKLTHSENVF